MDFGNLPDVGSVDFSLPSDDPRSAAFLRARKSAARRKVYVGAPLWSVKEWVGKVYPPKTPAKGFLEAYARQFNSIELNSTFYRIPEKKTLHSWRDSVPADFRFSPKIPQEISRSLKTTSLSTIKQACAALLELDDKLGCSFMQLPPSFAPANIELLERFLDALPQGFQIAIEFRHPGWFTNRVLIDEAYALLQNSGAAAVITDTAGRRDVVHAAITAPTVFVRFLGNELHPSDYTRLEDWVARLKKWMAAGVTEVYIYMHHGTYVNVPELSAYFIEKANASWGSKLRAWEPVAGASPQLSLI